MVCRAPPPHKSNPRLFACCRMFGAQAGGPHFAPCLLCPQIAWLGRNGFKHCTKRQWQTHERTVVIELGGVLSGVIN